MSSSSSSIVRAAIERAESRASVLNSLEKAYGTQQKASRRPAASIERNSSASSIKPVENVLNFIGDHRERTRKTLSEALLGKSIVLSNFKSQTDAAKSTRRAKR